MAVNSKKMIPNITKEGFQRIAYTPDLIIMTPRVNFRRKPKSTPRENVILVYQISTPRDAKIPGCHFFENHVFLTNRLLVKAFDAMTGAFCMKSRRASFFEEHFFQNRLDRRTGRTGEPAKPESLTAENTAEPFRTEPNRDHPMIMHLRLPECEWCSNLIRPQASGLRMS